LAAAIADSWAEPVLTCFVGPFEPLQQTRTTACDGEQEIARECASARMMAQPRARPRLITGVSANRSAPVQPTGRPCRRIFPARSRLCTDHRHRFVAPRPRACWRGFRLVDGRLNLTTLVELRCALDESHLVEILDGRRDGPKAG
jgi:hypothetical protein